MIRLFASGSVAVIALLGLYVAAYNAPVATGCAFYARCGDPAFTGLPAPTPGPLAGATGG